MYVYPWNCDFHYIFENMPMNTNTNETIEHVYGKSTTDRQYL